MKPESIKIISEPIKTLFTSRFLFLPSLFSAKWKKECNYPAAGEKGAWLSDDSTARSRERVTFFMDR